MHESSCRHWTERPSAAAVDRCSWTGVARQFRAGKGVVGMIEVLHAKFRSTQTFF